MKDEQRKPAGPGVEYIEDDINWTAGVGRPAGIYWLDGHSTIAAHGSPAEAHLLARGAALIATLLFEHDPRERVQRTGRIERVSNQFAARFVEQVAS